MPFVKLTPRETPPKQMGMDVHGVAYNLNDADDSV